ncbi:hypothetical protein NIES2130_03015 [Scytonema sp. HK-05]|nr:hypothetical protein NIES2130_03015 [Scytonema sp. HK-05]
MVEVQEKQLDFTLRYLFVNQRTLYLWENNIELQKRHRFLQNFHIAAHLKIEIILEKLTW